MKCLRTKREVYMYYLPGKCWPFLNGHCDTVNSSVETNSRASSVSRDSLKTLSSLKYFFVVVAPVVYRPHWIYASLIQFTKPKSFTLQRILIIICSSRRPFLAHDFFLGGGTSLCTMQHFFVLSTSCIFCPSQISRCTKLTKESCLLTDPSCASLTSILSAPNNLFYFVAVLWNTCL